MKPTSYETSDHWLDLLEIEPIDTTQISKKCKLSVAIPTRLLPLLSYCLSSGRETWGIYADPSSPEILRLRPESVSDRGLLERFGFRLSSSSYSGLEPLWLSSCLT